MVESRLHLKLKQATSTLSNGNHCSYECRYLYGDLRVDVRFKRKHRTYLVECETNPNIKRLKDKGRRRKRIKQRNVYILIAPKEKLDKLDLDKLRGCFDQVYGYESITGALNLYRDLRVNGKLRDKVLDKTYPYYVEQVAPLLYKASLRYIKIRNMVKGRLHCYCCKHDIPHPWRYCPRNDCPNSYAPYLENIVYLDTDTF